MTSFTRAVAFLTLALVTLPGAALIMVGHGNAPVGDSGWPLGAVDVANLKTRIGWWEGPPFGGGEWTFAYRGDTGALEEAVKAFSGIHARELQVVLHDGPQSVSFLADPKDPKGDPRYDWSFTVWVPGSWHRLFNDPRSTFMADSPNFRRPVAAPRLDVYLTDKVDWKKIVVPPSIRLIDERAGSGAGDKAAKPGAGGVAHGDVYDMATGKPINGVDITVERQPQNQKDPWAKLASGTSNAVGRFEVTAVPPGRCRVVASGPGYAPRVLGHEEIRDGSSLHFTVELCAAKKLSGVVVDEAGKPLAKVTVLTSNTMGIDGHGYKSPADPETASDDQGRFTLDDVPTGYTQFWARAPHRFHRDSMKLFAVPDDKSITIAVVATGTVQGKVVDAKGKPATGGTIHVSPPGDPIGKWGGSMNVEPDGSFKFGDVPPGPYTVSTRPQFPGDPPDPKAQKIDVVAGKTIDVTVKQ